MIEYYTSAPASLTHGRRSFLYAKSASLSRPYPEQEGPNLEADSFRVARLLVAVASKKHMRASLLNAFKIIVP